jgi:hypothetical protein
MREGGRWVLWVEKKKQKLEKWLMQKKKKMEIILRSLNEVFIVN